MSELYTRIYDTVRKIPRGKVAYYGQIARLCDLPMGARVVGYAMAACRQPDVPCHRVVDKQGRTKRAFDIIEPGFQRTVLEAEGVTFRLDGTVNMDACLWNGK